MKYDAYDDYCEVQVWFSVCRSCGWEDDETHAERDDCLVAECPECESDDISDKKDWK